MKVILLKCIFFISITIFVLSCNSEQRQINEKLVLNNDTLKVYNFEDLANKYENKNVTNCNELMEMANDLSEIYFQTIDNAAMGSEKAKSDFFDFEKFNKKFDDICNNIGDSCIEFINWKQNFNKKMTLYNNKIDSLYKLDTLQYHYKDVSDSVYSNLDKQLNDLNEDLKILLDTTK